MLKSSLRFLLIVFCFALSACKIELYSGLSERDANQMLAILLSNSIQASKTNLGDEGITLEVEESDLAAAITLLQENGYPRQVRESLGKVFEKSGIMSSPFEERIRFVFALGEEVSRTLSEIDGVLQARVHVVLPEEAALGKEVKPSSTAVFIKHRQGVDLDFFTPQIRRLVSSSIEGVEYDNVTVVMVEAEKSKVATANSKKETVDTLLGVRVHKADNDRFFAILSGAGLLAAFLLFSLLICFIALVRSQRTLSLAKAANASSEPEAIPQ